MVVGIEKTKSRKPKVVEEKKKKFEEEDDNSSEEEDDSEDEDADEAQDEEDSDDDDDDQDDESGDDDDDDDDDDEEEQPSPKKQKTAKQNAKTKSQSPENASKGISLFPISVMGHMAGLTVDDIKKLCPEAVDVKWRDLHKSVMVTLKSEEEADVAFIRLTSKKFNDEPLTVTYLGEKNEGARFKMSQCLPAKFNLLSLLVDDLPEAATENDIKKAFPKSSNIVMTLENSCAHVYFSNTEDTEKAFYSSEKLQIKGNLVTVVYGSAEKPGDQYTLSTAKFPDESEDGPVAGGEGFRGRGRGRGDGFRGRGGPWRGREGGDRPWRGRGDWTPRGGGDRGSWRGRGGSGDRGSWRGRGGGEGGSWRGGGGGGDGGERGSWRGRGGGDRGSWRGRGDGEGGGSPWRGGGGGGRGGGGFRGGRGGFGGGRGGDRGGGFRGRGGDRGGFGGRGGFRGRGRGFSQGMRPDISD